MTKYLLHSFATCYATVDKGVAVTQPKSAYRLHRLPDGPKTERHIAARNWEQLRPVQSPVSASFVWYRERGTLNYSHVHRFLRHIVRYQRQGRRGAHHMYQEQRQQHRPKTKEDSRAFHVLASHLHACREPGTFTRFLFYFLNVFLSDYDSQPCDEPCFDICDMRWLLCFSL